jgi:hypothetical protein
MSKLSGSQKRRRRKEKNRLEHERIVAESVATYRAYFVGWERKRAEYRRLIADAMGGAGLELPTYRKQLNRPPSTLAVDDIAVVLAAVDGFGERRGISNERIMLAFEFCGVGKQRAKISPCFRFLVTVGLIEKIGNYSAGHRGNQYRLTDAAMLAMGRSVQGRNSYPPLPPKRPKMLHAQDAPQPIADDAPF